MKWIAVLALLGAAGYFGYKHFYMPRSTAAGSADAKGGFIEACKHVSKKIEKVDEYCACLQQRGVKSMMMLGANAVGRQAMVDCQDKVGHSTAAPGLNPR